MPDMEKQDFKKKLIEQAVILVERSQKVQNEEGTKNSLVLPFLDLFGYDTRNPEEIHPEHEAGFSDRNINKVDYAILLNGQPVIAIECKNVGVDLSVNCRGQLKGYFNAVQSVKLGILTDGLIYEFYADSNSPNLMDDTPFMTLDLRDVAKGNLNDQTLDGIFGFCKPRFNPDNVGSEAKRKLVLFRIAHMMDEFSDNPPDDFVRFALSKAELANKLTQRIVEDYRKVVSDALRLFVDRKILQRMAISTSQLVKIAEKPETPPIDPIMIPPEVVTTEGELAVFKYARERLAFLVKTDDLFHEVSKVQFKDFKTKFIVFYVKERQGSLFSYQQEKDGKHKFIFPALADQVVITDNLSDIDNLLLESFKRRLQDVNKPEIQTGQDQPST